MDHTDEYIKEISEKIDSKKDYYAEMQFGYEGNGDGLG